MSELYTYICTVVYLFLSICITIDFFKNRMIICPLVDIENLDITVGRLMTEDVRFKNEIKSSIAMTKAAFYAATL